MTRDDDPSYDETLATDSMRPTQPKVTGDDATLATESARPAAPTTDPGPGASLPGYDVGALIGQGGMGEVILGHDKAIGREVAIKRLRRGASAVAVERFWREARIQARLEHPAIVPVHTLGRDESGDPYFTMKRLAGKTLAESLAGDPRPTQQELLRNLVDVCRALELAHARGVVHRDVKPQNVMLGNFGEVYVLDWGVARIVDEKEAVGAAGNVDTLDGLTQAGALFGTPGYMAPEQAEGSPDVGAPADVYAAGAMLFEILAGEALHPRGRGALASTLAGIDGSPARRRPERAIPPELDALCVRALAREPVERPTMRALADGIQGYLDGDRDHERRRELAARELAAARTTLAGGDASRRAEAIRAAGRALALDPESRDAATLITQLMLEPPREHPANLAAQLAASDAAVQRRQGKAATLSLCTALVFLAAVAVHGARDPWLLGGMAAYTIALAALAWFASRRDATPALMWVLAIGNAILASLISRMFGPFIVAPAVICIMAVSLASYPQLMQRIGLVIAMLLAAWLGPITLEHFELVESTWRVEKDAVVSMSSVIELGGMATVALVVGANIVAITAIALFANALARSRHAAQRHVEVQAWHLRQLLPD